MTQHRAGVNEGFLTKHKLKLTDLDKINAKAIQTELDALVAIDSVCIDLDKSTIKIAYDASHHDIDEIIGIIAKHGAGVSADRWNKWKLGWDRQVDQNIKDNAKHEPYCCKKLPPGDH